MTAPIIFGDAGAELRACTKKRRSRDQVGPVGLTPNSAERRLKEKRQKNKEPVRTSNKTLPSTTYSDEGEAWDHMSEDKTEEKEDSFDRFDLSTQATAQHRETGSANFVSKAPSQEANARAGSANMRVPLQHQTTNEDGNKYSDNLLKQPANDLTIKEKQRTEIRVTDLTGEGNEENVAPS